MVEGTGGIEFLLPVILAIVLSNWVAHHIHHAGAYESDLERIGEVYFLQSEPSQRLNLITARDIMAPDVIHFNEVIIILQLDCTHKQSFNHTDHPMLCQITSVTEVVAVLRETTHNGFPIIRHTNGDVAHPDGQVVGVMLRHQILLLLERRAILEMDAQGLDRRVQRHGSGAPRLTKEQKLLDRLMRVYHHYHHPHRRYLSSRPEAVDELGLEELLSEVCIISHSIENYQECDAVDEFANLTEFCVTIGAKISLVACHDPEYGGTSCEWHQ